MVIRMRTTSRPTSIHGRSRPAGAPGHAVAVLVALTAGLVPAFIFAPGPLATNMSSSESVDQRHLINLLSASFVDYWNSGEQNLTPDLKQIVDYWRCFHVVKALIAATLVAVLIALGVLLWKAFVRARGLTAGPGAPLATAATVVTALAMVSLTAVMANIQGALAPLSSLLTMLPQHPPHGALADTLGQVRQHLADYPNADGRTPPAVEVIVSDFSRYHVVIAVAALTVAVVITGLSVLSWRMSIRTEASDRRTRRIFRCFGLLSALASLTFAVLAVANVSTATEPAPALLGYFRGGW